MPRHLPPHARHQPAHFPPSNTPRPAFYHPTPRHLPPHASPSTTPQPVEWQENKPSTENIATADFYGDGVINVALIIIGILLNALCGKVSTRGLPLLSLMLASLLPAAMAVQSYGLWRFFYLRKPFFLKCFKKLLKLLAVKCFGAGLRLINKMFERRCGWCTGDDKTYTRIGVRHNHLNPIPLP